MTDFTCVCPTCTTGDRCEYSPEQFSISLEYLFEKTGWGLYHFLFPGLFLLLALVFNGLCFVTFLLPRARRTGTGVYLLIDCIINQLIFLTLFLRILYLYLIDRMVIRAITHRILCRALPYLMFSLYYTSLWLMAFVSVERAIAATLPGYYLSWGKPRFAAILSAFTLVLVKVSMFPQVTQYKVVPQTNPIYHSCIRQLESNEQYYTHYMPLLHQISPFLVNLIAALVIIIAISRSKATIHHVSARQALRQQTNQRKDLLLGPIMCFITQLPQSILLFLDICNYQSHRFFVHIILILHYLSFVPQLTLFFLYVFPSPLYRQLLIQETFVGKRVLSIISRQSKTVVKSNLFSLRSTLNR